MLISIVTGLGVSVSILSRDGLTPGFLASTTTTPFADEDCRCCRRLRSRHTGCLSPSRHPGTFGAFAAGCCAFSGGAERTDCQQQSQHHVRFMNSPEHVESYTVAPSSFECRHRWSWAEAITRAGKAGQAGKAGKAGKGWRCRDKAGRAGGAGRRGARRESATVFGCSAGTWGEL